MPRSQPAALPQEADPIDTRIGLRLRLRRKELGIPQTELARHLGLSFQQVQKYELGINRISASMLVRAAQRLKCSVADLVGEDEDEASGRSESALSAEGAMDLLVAYASIPADWRPMLVEMARVLSRGGGGDPGDR